MSEIKATENFYDYGILQSTGVGRYGSVSLNHEAT